MKQLIIILTILSGILPTTTNVCSAQEAEQPDSSAIVTNSLGDNWFLQAGFDMILINAYKQNFMDVFPNGKSFGIDVAAGKWFTPEYGVRARLNFENMLIKNDHATWMKDAGEKGYMALMVDMLFNVHNLFGDYDPDRRWNLSVYPRMGAIATLNKGMGSPIIGLGISNTYRLNDRWSLYADLGYQGISSVLGVSTDTGTGSNGFFNIDLGVQVDLGYNKFQKAGERDVYYQDAVAVNSFWSNWFAQAGLGMSLINAYGSNFANVFPNGKTLGLNLAVGKWFSPEAGLRLGGNWQNGIIGNSHLAWMDSEGQPGSNHDKGGWGAISLDAFFNLHNLFGDYREDRVWNAIVFPRIGLNSNFEAGSGSPHVGFGTEQTFRIGSRLKLFADVAYQFTTSELTNQITATTHDDGNSNGWFDINIGIQYDLGKTRGWKKLDR